MGRTALTDGSGSWFDKDKAKFFDESTYWNGSNHISKATGSQHNHERLYRTASGSWVMHAWSQWQGSGEEYLEITNREAAKWFAQNEYQDEDIPDDILKIIKDDLSDLEV